MTTDPPQDPPDYIGPCEPIDPGLRRAMADPAQMWNGEYTHPSGKRTLWRTVFVSAGGEPTVTAVMVPLPRPEAATDGDLPE